MSCLRGTAAVQIIQTLPWGKVSAGGLNLTLKEKLEI